LLFSPATGAGIGSAAAVTGTKFVQISKIARKIINIARRMPGHTTGEDKNAKAINVSQ